MTTPERSPAPRPPAPAGGLSAQVVRLKAELAAARARIRRLERLADLDDLSLLANRRAFRRELSRAIDYCDRYAVPASVVYLDLDGMKAINDRLGHAAGDAVIRHVARLLQSNLRASDLVARLGGDEFGLILARADRAAAAAKATQLARLIAARPLAWRGARVALSASWGAYTFQGRADAAQALERADEAMYRNKRRRAVTR